MCMSSPKPPPAPPPPAPMAPAAPLATVETSDGNNRKDSAYLRAGRGRNSLRIDRTVSGAESSGSGLNIPA